MDELLFITLDTSRVNLTYPSSSVKRPWLQEHTLLNSLIHVHVNIKTVIDFAFCPYFSLHRQRNVADLSTAPNILYFSTSLMQSMHN